MENWRKEETRREKDISLLVVLVPFSYPSLSTLSLRFLILTSASLRVVSKIATESYCRGAHWALTLGRGRPEYPKSMSHLCTVLHFHGNNASWNHPAVLTSCSQLLEKIGFLSLETVSLFSRIFLWWCKVPYMSDDVFIKILTAWNVKITGNGGNQSTRMQVCKGPLEKP